MARAIRRTVPLLHASQDGSIVTGRNGLPKISRMRSACVARAVIHFGPVESPASITATDQAAFHAAVEASELAAFRAAPAACLHAGVRCSASHASLAAARSALVAWPSANRSATLTA